MALKRINKELTDLGRYVRNPSFPSSSSFFTVISTLHLRIKRLCEDVRLTFIVFYSDPPSSCSAGPIGDDLVRRHLDIALTWGRNNFVHKTMSLASTHVLIHLLTRWIRIVPLASYHHGTCKCALIFASLPEGEKRHSDALSPKGQSGMVGQDIGILY